MKTNKIVPAWVSIVLIVLIIASAAWCVHNATQEIVVPPAESAALEAQPHITEIALSKFIQKYHVKEIITIIVLIAAVLHCALGYREHALWTFKVFVCLYAVALSVNLMDSMQQTNVPVLEIASFGILCAMALSRDVGKRRSFVYCALLVAMAFAKFLVVIFQKGWNVYGSTTGDLLLAIIYGIVVYTWYAAADARITK